LSDAIQPITLGMKGNSTATRWWFECVLCVCWQINIQC